MNDVIDTIDRRIIAATQEGLPLTPRPYVMIAEQLGLDADDVMDRMQRMLANGAIRRIGAIPNHYALGFRGNGMSVWDVPDDSIKEAGHRIGDLDFVSHCYHRPRHLPTWPYNLFAMVHGRDRAEVDEKVRHIAAILGVNDRGHEVLFSTRILKKTGLRIGLTGVHHVPHIAVPPGIEKTHTADTEAQPARPGSDLEPDPPL